MKNLKKMSAWMLATVLAASVSAAVKAAGPLDSKVPAESIAYLGWAGADSLAPQYAGSNLKGILDASAAKQFVAQWIPKLIEMAGQRDPQAPETIAKLQAGLAIAWQHPGAIYFCPADFSNPQMPALRMGIICDAGSNAKALNDLMAEALSKMPPPPPDAPQLKIIQEGSLVILTVGKTDTAADLAKGGGLAASPNYVKAIAHVKVAKPAMTSYVDIAAGVAMFNDAMTKMPTPPDVKVKAPIVIDALGLNSLTQMASASGFEGKEWTEQAFVGVTGPKKGILSIIGSTPLSDGVLAAVPKDAVSFATIKLDPQSILNEVRTVVGKIDDQAGRQIDQGLAMGSQQTGMDIEKDIIAPFGDEWVLYRAPLSDVGGNSFAMVHKLRDGEKMAATIAKAEMMINTIGEGKFKIDKVTAGKIEFSSVSFLQYSAAWTVRNGYLYISSVDGLAGAVKQVENKRPSIVESDLYKQAIAGLPAGVKPLSIAYSNPAKIYPELRRLALGVLPLARAAGVDIPAGILPDVDDVGQFMTPGATISWWDADGLHLAGHSAFPGARLIGGSPGGGPGVVAGAAMGTAILLPSLNQARASARRTVDMSNEKQLTIGCLITAADNNDQMPDDLARLVANGQVSTKQLVSTRAATPVLEMTPELQQLSKNDFAKFSELISQHSDYVYLGKGTKSDSDGSLILIYEKAGAQTSEGINVSFHDGHCEFVRWNMAEQTFVTTNEYLKKNNLPTVDVADLIRKSGVKTAQLPAMHAPGGLP